MARDVINIYIYGIIKCIGYCKYYKVCTLIFRQRPVSWVAGHLRRAPGAPAAPAAGGSGEGGAGAGPQHPHTRPRLPRCDPPCPNTPYDTIITTSHALANTSESLFPRIWNLPYHKSLSSLKSAS